MRVCRSCALVVVSAKRSKKLGKPSSKLAGESPDPETSADPVTDSLNLKLPARWWSLGTRRFWALRISPPHLVVWFPWIFVQLFTHWNTFSVSASGQLHWLLPR